LTSLKEIRRRIRTVRSTGEITKAMEMVASARLRSLQRAINSFLSYASGWDEVIRQVLADKDAAKEISRIFPSTAVPVVITLGSDKGLVGGYNHRLVDLVIKQFGKEDFNLIVVGRRIRDLFRRRQIVATAEFENISHPPFYQYAEGITRSAWDLVQLGRVGSISICFTPSQEGMPQVETLLPPDVKGKGKPVLWEPKSENLLPRLLPLYLRSRIESALLSAAVSEEIARASSMGEATKNAEDLLEDLIREYNSARQGAITAEILDVVGGSQAESLS